MRNTRGIISIGSVSTMGYPCNCSRALTDEQGNLISNPDVAGIGVRPPSSHSKSHFANSVLLIIIAQVLIGLTLPALATFVLLLVYYLSAVDPNRLDMWTKLDISFLKWLHAKRPHWRTSGDALERVSSIHPPQANEHCRDNANHNVNRSL